MLLLDTCGKVFTAAYSLFGPDFDMPDSVSSVLPFDNTFARELEGFFVPWDAEKAPQPKLLMWNDALAAELGGAFETLSRVEAVDFFSGNIVPDDASPLAQAYAGHQFGGFSPQLGDGRALLLGEVIDTAGRRRDLQLKGSGRTPFSRGGDGKAPLGPVLREYLIGEAMHALGVPTTRALAAVATGESVFREGALPGAVLTRVAASHLRVGTFQFFAARQESDKVRQLADYAIARHYPHLEGRETRYLDFFDAVLRAQASLVARWMNIGFIHGVMNTDNTTISGETIDYGPCAFMDIYAADTVFSSIDTQGRYAYKNQPVMAQWNLARLAEALIGVVDPDAEKAVSVLTEKIGTFPEIYAAYWLNGMRAKMGLTKEDIGDLELANDLLSVMEGQHVDYTLAMRRLSSVVRGDDAPLLSLFDEPAVLDEWLTRWRERLSREDIAAEDRAAAMDSVNPVYIPRNHLVEAALDAAVSSDDLGPFTVLLDVVRAPFGERPDFDDYARPGGTDAAPYQTFCGT